MQYSSGDQGVVRYLTRVTYLFPQTCRIGFACLTSKSPVELYFLICLHTELPQKRSRSSTQSSDDLALQQSVAKKSVHDYTTIKMDLLARDISDLHSESDPEVIIKLLYSNALSTISDLLKPHLMAVKKTASQFRHLGLHNVAVGEDIIEAADSIDSLLSRMSVTGMWDKTCFLRKAVHSIPPSASERSVAEDILSHYEWHLSIYEHATLLKDALPKEPTNAECEKAANEEEKLVPLKITSRKPISSFTCEDCYRIQARLLSKAYGIPEEKIICHDTDEDGSKVVCHALFNFTLTLSVCHALFNFTFTLSVFVFKVTFVAITVLTCSTPTVELE